MKTQFAYDLRLARRKAGYTQRDVAHLLASRQSVVSGLESGNTRPTLEQIIALSLIFGRTFDCLFDELMRERRSQITRQLKTLPDGKKLNVYTFNRSGSLSRLQKRLDSQPYHGSA